MFYYLASTSETLLALQVSQVWLPGWLEAINSGQVTPFSFTIGPGDFLSSPRDCVLVFTQQRFNSCEGCA